MCSVSSSVTGGGGGSGASLCQVSEDLDGNRRILKGIKKMSKQQRRSITESVLSPVCAAPSSSFRVKSASGGSRISRRDSVSGGSITSRSSNGGRRSSRSRSGSISDYGYVDPGIPKSICLS